MYNGTNQSKVRMLYQMLFEMATGNLSFRIDDHRDDELDQLAVILNEVAEKMHTAILDSGFVDPHYNYQGLVQATIILDSKFIIKSFSGAVASMFGFKAEELFNIEFDSILAENSRQLWDGIKSEPATNNDYHKTVLLTFLTSCKKLLPSFCTISKLLYSNKIVVSSVTTILQDSISDLESEKPAAPLKTEAIIMQEVYVYIMDHLEKQLPGSKEISIHFGMNEFKLKKDFRHFFKTSIHQFYNEERLKKAHLLIQQSDEPIKNIAQNCGFSTYLNFYKAFKKRFGYAPSELKRDNSYKI